jgi:hypothetical protein
MIEINARSLENFVRVIGKVNQVIYEEAIVELCCPPDHDREEFDEDSVIYSNSKASDTAERDDIENKVVKIDTTSKGAMHANGACNPVNDDSDITSLVAVRGRVKGTISPKNDESPGEVTKTRRVRSVRKPISVGPNKKSKWLGRPMGRGIDNELTTGSSPMKRSRPRSPRQNRSPRRVLTAQRRSLSNPWKSSTTKREGAKEKKSEAATPTTKDKSPATSKATLVSSTLGGRAGGEFTKNLRKGAKDKNKNKPTRVSVSAKLVKSTSKASTHLASNVDGAGSPRMRDESTSNLAGFSSGKPRTRNPI